jgi:hypothetical protein
VLAVIEEDSSSCAYFWGVMTKKQKANNQPSSYTQKKGTAEASSRVA